MKIYDKQLLALLALLLLSVQPSEAQRSWSAGFRMGPELKNFNLSWSRDFESKNLVLNYEAFISRKLGKHFEFEASVRSGSVHNKGYSSVYDSYESYDYDQISTNVSLFINARYNFKVGKRIEIYPQLGTSFTKPFTKTALTTYELGKAPRYTNAREGYSIVPFKTISPAIGISYNAFNRLYINLTASANYKLDGGGYTVAWYTNMDKFPNDWSANVLLGFGYRF